MDDFIKVSWPSQLAAVIQQTADLGLVASEPRTGALVRALAASKPGGRLLELGTGARITRWDPCLTLVTQDGLLFLQAQPAASFDFVFADAMPGKYDGLEESLRVIKPGGFYVIDDLVPQVNWPEGKRRESSLAADALVARADFQRLSMAWSSGLLLAVRKVSVS